MIWLGLIGALASAPHYGRVQFRLKPTSVSAEELEVAVRQAAEARGTAVDVRREGRRGKLSQLDPELLRILKIMLETDQGFRGTELDLFLGPRAQRVPVTLRWEGRRLSVEQGPVWKPVWPRTSRGIVAGRYGLGGIEDGSRDWNRPLLGMVERAFERLSESERQVLEGMRLRADHTYRAGKGEPEVPFTPGAVYRADEHLIQVFDASFGPSFVGGVDDPEPVGVFMLLHEIAHAIDALSEGEPPSERFSREVPGVSVTSYGATSGHEAFAEAFALWRTDRDALVRISKDAAVFFDEDRHLLKTPAVTGPTDTGP